MAPALLSWPAHLTPLARLPTFPPPSPPFLPYLPRCYAFVQRLFGKMMNSIEELDAAADAFSEKYLAEHALLQAADATTAAATAATSPPSHTASMSKALQGLFGGSSGVGQAAGGGDAPAGGSNSGDSSTADADQHSRDQQLQQQGPDLEAAAAAPSVISTVTTQQHHSQQPRRLSLFGGRGKAGDSSAEGHSSASWLTQCRCATVYQCFGVRRVCLGTAVR